MAFLAPGRVEWLRQAWWHSLCRPLQLEKGTEFLFAHFWTPASLCAADYSAQAEPLEAAACLWSPCAAASGLQGGFLTPPS
jgi:hypothetical protein